MGSRVACRRESGKRVGARVLDSRSCDSWSPALLRQESSLLARHEQRINHRHSSASQAVALASKGAGEGGRETLDRYCERSCGEGCCWRRSACLRMSRGGERLRSRRRASLAENNERRERDGDDDERGTHKQQDKRRDARTAAEAQTDHEYK